MREYIESAYMIKSIKLNRKGFELDFEIFIKLTNLKNFFLEVPVKFKPRTKKQGKKKQNPTSNALLQRTHPKSKAWVSFWQKVSLSNSV